ncbi:hypothetical protein MHBO_004799 [Bonamia ostreae]|uniref:Macro domain-containing protein n=1 Tax=Bonamia ostreae TaxID=126728 RepID=A0ABV2AUB7_9EUKA
MEFEVETLKVKIYQSSILDVKVDTIVNAADEYLTNGSGVSKAIEDAGGYEYQKGCETLLKLHGPTLKTSHVYDSRRGRLRDKFKVILHAIGPRWIDHEDKEKCLFLLMETVESVLKMADSLVTTSLAMPAISSGTTNFQIQHCNIFAKF